MMHYGDTEWRDKGRAAYYAGRGQDECPLRHWSDARCEWIAGWDEAALEDVEGGTCPKCGDESLPANGTGERNGLCDDCLHDVLEMME